MQFNWLSVIFGVAAILFGVYTLLLRNKSPEKLGKLGPMKKFYGEKKGQIIHIITYTVAPIVFGIIMLVKGILGI